MSKVVRFRRLRHGDPPRFKVLPDDLRKRSSRTGSRRTMRSFPIIILALVGVAALLVVGGFVA